jgi:sulfhydrogenase subunit delta
VQKPKIGFYSLTGCGGDQLMILNHEDELLRLLNYVEVVSFQEASSLQEDKKVDIAFVEGSVSTKMDLDRLNNIRKGSKTLIAIGDCAIGGCVQAMRNEETTIEEMIMKVYGKGEDYFEVLEPYGLSKYVKVDLELQGCPIETTEIRQLILSLLHGNVPEIKDYPVCVECKLNEYQCLLVDKGMPCLGPIIAAGCNARCPGLGIDCVGCRGPIPNETNAAEELRTLKGKGFDEKYIENRLRFFGANFEGIAKLSKILREKKSSNEGTQIGK